MSNCARTADGLSGVSEDGKTSAGLSGNQIKWIAIAAMLIDHIAWGFVPFASVLGQLMHVIGRITAPTMCFFIAEGYYYTRNVKKYAIRLGIFALISHVPYVLFETGKPLSFFPFSVIYTLFLSLLAVWAWDRIDNKTVRFCAIMALCILSLPGDWQVMDILFSIIFWNYRGNFKNQARWFSVMAACMVVLASASMALNGKHFYSQFFQAGVFLCLPILSLYNGKRGGGKNSKWTFYIFYPAHLLALGLMKIFI